jgi:hypothetical protein
MLCAKNAHVARECKLGNSGSIPDSLEHIELTAFWIRCEIGTAMSNFKRWHLHQLNPVDVRRACAVGLEGGRDERQQGMRFERAQPFKAMDDRNAKRARCHVQA